MTRAQLKAFQDGLKKMRKKTGKSPKRAKALLIKAGIMNKQGKLASMYR
jgi:hypothetical protein